MEFNNDYTSAGKGAKHRERQRRALVRDEARSKPNRDQTVAAQSRGEGTGEKGRRQRPHDVKDRIRRLHLDHGLRFDEMCARLKQDGYLVSAVTVSAIRTEFVQALKLLISIGLVDPDELEKHRRKRPRARVRLRA
ncbi:hypothetical protein [Bradyrhizobium guangzhouense]|uniref:hypothetical protein n=1 Tax=Bradyrhizobium guangzhouense TaxID=1325095 RepID=UPI001009CC12|nr:hypothetical protein [Bradyrhizobium guangzhouense]